LSFDIWSTVVLRYCTKEFLQHVLKIIACFLPGAVIFERWIQGRAIDYFRGYEVTANRGSQYFTFKGQEFFNIQEIRHLL